MNRRSSIKYFAFLTTFGVSSFSLYRIITSNSSPDLAVIRRNEKLIAELAEVIIPRTETPGAKDAHVEDFIINMIMTGSDEASQHTFIEGLKDVQNYSLAEYGKNFLQLDSIQKIEVLTHFENKSNFSNRFLNKVKNKLFGSSFFQRFKDLTVEGYCTSRVGATQGLAYIYIPSTYESCILINENQRSWATK